MLILSRKEAVRVTLRAATDEDEEAWVLLAPIKPPLRRKAYRAARAILRLASLENLPLELYQDFGEVVVQEFVRIGAIEWGGIGDGSGILPITPDRETRLATAEAQDRPEGTIDLLLDDEDHMKVLDREYVGPDALRSAEKNGLRASPSGIGEAATPEKAIASSSAAKKKRAAAPPARTARTRRAPPRAKPSGKS